MAMMPACMVMSQEKVTYDDHVKPIFTRRCSSCHNSQKRSADLDLTNYTNLMQGGSSGSSIEPGDAGGSFLYMLVTHEESPEMPPGGTKIPDAEIATIAKWIDAGALENASSKARLKKTNVALSSAGSVGTRPEVVAYPSRLPVESVGKTDWGGSIVSLSVSQWAPILAVSVPRQVLLYDTKTLSLLGVLPYPEGQATVLRFSQNGALLLAAGGTHGAGGKVTVWDVVSGERVIQVADELDNILAADISSDHRLIAVGGPQKLVRVYSTADGQLLHEIKKHTEWVTSLSFSPDGVLLASGDRNGGVHVWEAASGDEYLTLPGHSKNVSATSWRSDANVLLTASGDGTVKLWEMENGNQIRSFTAHGGGTTNAFFARDNRIASCGRDFFAKMWQQDGKLIRQFPKSTELPLAVVVCSESDRFFYGDVAGNLNGFQAKDGVSLGKLETNLLDLSSAIAQCEGPLNSIEQELVSFTQQLSTMIQKRDSITAQITQAQNELSNLSKQEAENSAKISQVGERLEAAAKQRAVWQDEVESKQAAIPVVKESQSKAAEAAEKLPNDVELKQTAEQLSAKVQSLETNVSQLLISISESEKGAGPANIEIENLKKALQSLGLQKNEATKSLAAAKAELAPIEKPVADLQKRITELNLKKIELQQKLTYFRGEVEFLRQLKALKSQLTDANSQVSSRQEIVDETKAKLDHARQEYESSLKEKSSAEQKAAGIQAKIEELKVRK